MSKSRQEKTKTPAQSAPPPPVSNDIVPGRFTESDWNQMLDAEDSEDFVYEIVQEIVQSTMGVLHDKYIESQTLPYTVQEARQVLLDIIEWQFLACDNGEDNPSIDATWLEEDEPIAPMTDSWAQGSVPVMMPRPVSTESSATSVSSEANSEDSCIEEERPEAPAPPFENLEIPDTPLTIPSPVQPSQQNSPQTKPIIQPQPPPKKETAKKKRHGPFTKKHKGKLPPYSGVDLTSVTDVRLINSQFIDSRNDAPTLDQKGMTLLSSSSSILKSSKASTATNWSDDQRSYSGCVSSFSNTNIMNTQTQHGRPPGNKDVVYDEWGNVAAVIKLNPEKLPSYRVRTKFTIIDQSNESNVKNRKSKMSSTSKRESRNTVSGKGTGFDTGNAVRIVKEGVVLPGPVTPLPPPLVDSMDISAGVVVREGQVVRRGPIQVPRKIDRRLSPAQLQPLDATPSARGTAEVVPRSSPVIRPLHLSDPIPPIPTQPSPQSA